MEASIRSFPVSVLLIAFILGMAPVGQAEEGVLVLPSLATEFAWELNLVDGLPTVPRQVRIAPQELGPLEITDIKVMPDGTFLLADATGRGAASYSPEDGRFQAMAPPLFFGIVSAVSVARYYDPSAPATVVFADSLSSIVTLRNFESGAMTFGESFFLPGARAFFSQAISMPDRRIAVSTTWRSLGLSGIDILATDGSQAPLRFLSQERPDRPATVVPEIDRVREIMAVEDRGLLVTTPFQIFFLSEEGQVDLVFDIGDVPELGGELAGARKISDNRIAAATYEPGQWNRPSDFHRVIWLDAHDYEVVAVSEPLTFAPFRVEARNGHGATGTFGYDADLQDLLDGDPDDLALASVSLNRMEYTRTDRIDASATLRNDGDAPVSIASFFVDAWLGACQVGAPIRLAEVTTAVLEPTNLLTAEGQEAITLRFENGAWCARAGFQDAAGQTRYFDESVDFEIRQQGEGSDTRIVENLPFGDDVRQPDPGEEGEEEEPEEEEPDAPGEGGCCAATGGASEPLIPSLLLAFFFLRSRRRK